MSFDRGELERMQITGLKRLAEYLGIGMTDKTEKGEVIDKILAELDKRSRRYRDYGNDYNSSLPDVPRFSVRVQRIMDAKREKGEL